MAKLTSDPELLAMGQLQKIMDGLDQDIRCRIMAWLGMRYGVRSIEVVRERRDEKPDAAIPVTCKHPGYGKEVQ